MLDIESNEKHYMKTLDAIDDLLKLFKFAVESVTGEEDEYIYLNSSSDKKISFHIIGKVLFKNLSHAGAIVRSVWSAIQSIFKGLVTCPESLQLDNLKYLFEANGDWIVDDCIYTRNRFFRIPLSSKMGSSRVLKPVVNVGRRNLRWWEMLAQPCSTGAEVHSAVEMGGSDPIFTSLRASKCMRLIGDSWFMSESRRTNYQSQCLTAHPYIEPVLSKLESLGYMLKSDLCFNSSRRSWCVNSHSRLCGIAKREHASNHVWFEIDGIGGRVLQRCYDSNCSGFVEVDVDDAWDAWTIAYSTMVDVTDVLAAFDSSLLKKPLSCGPEQKA